jgi:glucan-binding YG repeat protein
MSKIYIAIDDLFELMDDNIVQFITEKRPEEKIIHSNLRYSFNKIYEKLKDISERYDVSFRVPNNVKHIKKINPEYTYQPIGNKDWLIFTDQGEFVYITQKGKWYVFNKNAYYNDELGSSITQEKLNEILLKVRQF